MHYCIRKFLSFALGQTPWPVTRNCGYLHILLVSKSRFSFFFKEKMWPNKAIARPGHACGCSLRTILRHQLARIFLADGYLVSMLLSSYSYCICISLKSVIKDISDFCLSSCSCNIHWIWLKYLLTSTEVECKQHLYTSNRYSINLGVLRGYGFYLQWVTTLEVFWLSQYATAVAYTGHGCLPWGNKTALPMLHVSFLNPALLCWDEHQLQTALEEQKLSLVPIPLLVRSPTCGYLWKKGQYASDLLWEQNICLPQLESLIKSRGALPSSSTGWSSAFFPRTPDWQNSSVDLPGMSKSGGWELAGYSLGRLMLRQGKCFAAAFWPSHASPCGSGALSWKAFSWKKIFLLPFCK